MFIINVPYAEESSQRQSRNVRDVSSLRTAVFSAALIADTPIRNALQWLIFSKLYGGR
jgi:hypothetical protein